MPSSAIFPRLPYSPFSRPISTENLLGFDPFAPALPRSDSPTHLGRITHKSLGRAYVPGIELRTFDFVEQMLNGIGRSVIGSLYQLRLVESGLATAGTLLIIRFDVIAGTDYCLLTGRDTHAADINLSVYDDKGALIKEDISGQSRGAVRWRSSYTGTATAYVHMVRTTLNRPAGYAAFLGVSQMPRTGPAQPGSNPVPGQ